MLNRSGRQAAPGDSPVAGLSSRERRSVLRIFALLRSILAWIIKDSERPSLAQLALPLLLLLLSPLFAALSLLLIPAAILERDIPARVVDAFQRIAPFLIEAQGMPSAWTIVLCIAIPGFYTVHSVFNYFGRKQLLTLSSEFHRKLLRRVAVVFRAELIKGNPEGIDSGTSKRLMMADARYISRTFLSLAAALPALVTAFVAFGILVILVPGILLAMVVVLLLFAPLQAIVAAEGQRHSTSFLDQTGKFGARIIRTLRAFTLLPFPDSAEPRALERQLADQRGDLYFEAFRERTRIGYFGEFATGLAVATMLFMLVLAFRLFPSPLGQFSAEKIILTLVAARYLFKGVGAVTQAVVGLGNTYPYYRAYMELVEVPGSQGSALSASSDAAAQAQNSMAGCHSGELDQIIVVAGEPPVGLIVRAGGDIWGSAATKSVIYRSFAGRMDTLDASSLSCMGHDKIVPPVSREELDRLSREMMVQVPKLRHFWLELAALIWQGEVDLTPVSVNRRDVLAWLAYVYAIKTVRVVLVGQGILRAFRQAERGALYDGLLTMGIQLVVVIDDGEEPIKPEPSRFLILESDGTLTEGNRSDAIVALHAGQTAELVLPSELYLGVSAESPIANWQTISAALATSSGETGHPEIRAVSAWGPATLQQMLEVGEAGDHFDLVRLRERFPMLSSWWIQLEQALVSQTERDVEIVADAAAALPPIEFTASLGHALTSAPIAVVLLRKEFAELDVDVRSTLVQALEQAGIRLLIWNVVNSTFDVPRPQGLVHLRSAGRPHLIHRRYLGSMPFRPDSSPVREMVVSLPGELPVTLDVGKQLGIIANNSDLTWNEVRYFRSLAGRVTPFFGSRTALIAPGFIEHKVFLDLIAPQLAQIDFAALHACYPGLSREWADITPFVSACALNKLDDFAMACTSPATCFWLVVAVALDGGAKLLFVRERDFRLIAQKARTRLLNSLQDHSLVVWKENVSTPFVQPRPKHSLAVANSGVIAVLSEGTTWDELAGDIRREVLRERFAPSSIVASMPLPEQEEI